MNALKMMLMIGLLVMAGMQVTHADEHGRLKPGVVQGVNAAHSTIRFDGHTYRVDRDAEIMETGEGGTIQLRYIRKGSRIAVHFNQPQGQKEVVIDYIEVRSMPLK